MKYSVLLPTRNGGRLLRNCILSVLDQSYVDMQLVVVDNASTDNTHEVVSSFASDPRLKYVRIDEGVPVTENWNNALQESQGEYFVMLGDDDYLLPEFFYTVDQLLDQYSQPECLFYNAVLYVFPDSVAHIKASYYSESHFNLCSMHSGLIPKETRFQIVRDMFHYKSQFPTNMQTVLVSRRLANRIPGGIFQPLFPDLYARVALLLEATSAVCVPNNLAIVGLSPKSFGHYFYNGLRNDGMRYLGIDYEFDGRLPGNALNDCVFITLNRLAKRYTDLLGTNQVSRIGYVERQVLEWLLEFKLEAIPMGELITRFRTLEGSDWVGLFVSMMNWKNTVKLLERIRPKSNRMLPEIPGVTFTPLPDVEDIRSFGKWLQAHRGVI